MGYGRLEFYADICRAYLPNEAKHAEWLEYDRHHNVIRTQKDAGHILKRQAEGSVLLLL
jgi:hypothetical protein